VPVIGVHVPAGRFHGCVPEDLLKHVQWHAGGHPRCSRVAESVTGEIGQAEPCDDRVPVGGIPYDRRGEHTILRPDEEPILRSIALG
jgi:hypothetical protein